jgi:hypothetical protein
MRRTLGAMFAAGMSLVALGCGGTVTDAPDSAPISAARDSAAVDDAQSEAAVACSSGYDCSSLFTSAPSSSVPCCTDEVCRLEPYDDCTDANAQLIQASNYDQSCTTDTDCVAVAEGNFCYPGAGNCPNAAISKSANAQYQADTAKTRAASCYAPGNCGTGPGPCCLGGTCSFSLQCPLNPPLNPAPTCALGAATCVIDAGASTTLLACQWPASLNDAGPGACTVGRAYVVCSYPSGGGELCISDDPTSCPGFSSTACTNKCAPNEYAVSCGGPPPGPTADGGAPAFTYQEAPAGCVSVGFTPGGNEYSCCPCE